MRRSPLGPMMAMVLVLLVFLPGQVRLSSGQSFTNPQVLQYLPGPDSYPSALQASNGTLWIVWQHSSISSQIYYELFSGTSWSAIGSLPTGTPGNLAPSVGQISNGTIMLLWSSNQTGHWNLYYKTLRGSAWSGATQLTSGVNDDFFPQPVVARDSTLWVFWQRMAPTGTDQIYYKTLKGNLWSADTQLTFDSTPNVTPTAMAARDGRLWVAWSRFNSVTSDYDVFYRTFNGTLWSGDVQVTNNLTWDLQPNLTQDRNGTIWLFWSRQIQLTSGTNAVYEQKLFSKFSTNLGQTWSGDTQLTFAGDATNPVDDLEPSVVQGATRNLNGSIDRGLWLFFSSDMSGFGSDFDIYYIRSSQIFPVHDVAVTSVQSYPTKMFPWGLRALNIAAATISVTVANPGDYPENISLAVQAVNKTSFNVGSASFLLSSGASKVVSFAWNASTAAPGVYTVAASVAPVPGETTGSTGNDTLRAKALSILYPGDLNLSGQVTILDASIFGVAWNSTPGSPNWNPDADINHNLKVDILDASIFGANWQKSI